MADIYACYSRLELFSLANLEAMYCKKTIVATNINEKYLTDGYDAFLFDIHDPKKCYKLIETFIKDPELRKKMSKNAKRTVMEKYIDDITFKKFLELINEE